MGFISRDLAQSREKTVTFRAISEIWGRDRVEIVEMRHSLRAGRSVGGIYSIPERMEKEWSKKVEFIVDGGRRCVIAQQALSTHASGLAARSISQLRGGERVRGWVR